jgi:hypothetical protein
VKKVLGAVCITLSLLVVPAAQGAERIEVDRTHGVRFELDGRVLTVRLLPQQDRARPDIRREVWGRRIDAICSPVFHPRRPPVRQIRLWPRGELQLRFRFDRDVSYGVKWCLIEDDAEDVAAVSFGRLIRIFGSSDADKRTGRRLRSHLKREAASATWLPRVRALVVTDGSIVVGTDLPENRRARQIARKICGLIETSGVPAPPPDLPHSVFSRDDATLATCRAPQLR